MLIAKIVVLYLVFSLVWLGGWWVYGYTADDPSGDGRIAAFFMGLMPILWPILLFRWIRDRNQEDEE